MAVGMMPYIYTGSVIARIYSLEDHCNEVLINVAKTSMINYSSVQSQ